MKIRLLPSSITDARRIQTLTSYLINSTVAVDGGSLGFALSSEELHRIRDVILTHTHLDHIASLPIFISDAFDMLHEPIRLFTLRSSMECLRNHIFNDQIWPDFEQIRLPNGNGAGFRFVEIEPGKPFRVMGLNVIPVLTNHTVPTIGLAIEDEHAAVILTSDTYVTDELWSLANRLERLQAIFVDVSYPNEMDQLAEYSKHLTPAKLDKELRALRRPVPVFAFHMKSHYGARIAQQLQALQRHNVRAGEIDHEYEFP